MDIHSGREGGRGVERVMQLLHEVVVGHVNG